MDADYCIMFTFRVQVQKHSQHQSEQNHNYSAPESQQSSTHQYDELAYFRFYYHIGLGQISVSDDLREIRRRGGEIN